MKFSPACFDSRFFILHSLPRRIETVVYSRYINRPLTGELISMLQFVLATLCALSAESRAVTFDEAKADASKRMAYVGQLLDKQVFDKDKNPNGLIKAWYFVADEKQKAA